MAWLAARLLHDQKLVGLKPAWSKTSKCLNFRLKMIAPDTILTLCVCVCVCVKKREKESKKEREAQASIIDIL